MDTMLHGKRRSRNFSKSVKKKREKKIGFFRYAV